jgi:hypothetical protein
VVLCPDVAPFIGSRFDCCDLLQRSGIHYGAERKASSAIISTPHSGRNDRPPELVSLSGHDVALYPLID